MARPVLTGAARRWAGVALLAALVVLNAPAVRAQAVCPAVAGGDAGTTLRIAERSPLYLLAKERLGPATGCQVTKDADSETLVVSFARGGALTVSSSPAIEFASQALDLGRLQKRVTPTEAIRALRRTETEATGRDGCGIRWSRWRAAAGSPRGDVTLSGDVCNCKATFQTKGGAVTGLGFSTAC